MLLGEAKSSVLMVPVIAFGKLFKDLVIDETNFQTGIEFRQFVNTIGYLQLCRGINSLVIAFQLTLTLLVPIPGEEEKIGALKAFIKTFEAL